MPVTVAQILRDKKLEGVVDVGPDDSVNFALTKMMKHNIAIVAVKRRDNLLGFFGHRDCSNRVILAGLSPTLTTVGEVMTHFTEDRYVVLDTLLADCIEMMSKYNVNHLPVMRGEGEYRIIIGMISNRDINREIVTRKMLRDPVEDLNEVRV